MVDENRKHDLDFFDILSVIYHYVFLVFLLLY